MDIDIPTVFRPERSFSVEGEAAPGKRAGVLALVFLLFAAGAAARDYGVGYTRLSTTDPMGGGMSYSLWYPSAATDDTVEIGPFEFPGTRDAAPAPDRFALVLLSHGSGGTDLVHRDTAIALARAGFLAAAPLHPRNNVYHDVHDDRRVVLDGRPRQLSAVIDALLAHPTWSRRIDARKIAAFGFSAGGYTVLAALGAARNYGRTLEHCARHGREDPYCRVIDGPGRARRVKAYGKPVQPFRDPRICAAVLADPFTAPFSDAALERLAPVHLLVYRPEMENRLGAAFHAGRLVRLLRRRDDFPQPREIVVPDANHYSFIASLPEAVARRHPRIAYDHPGFDRAAFHDTMNNEIVRFLAQGLSACASG